MVGADAVEKGFRVPAGHPHLAERRLVEHGRALVRLLHLPAHLVEPGRLAEGKHGLPGRAEVQRPFEAVHLAEMRALRPPPMIERQRPQSPARRPLASRVRDFVVLAQHLGCPLGQGGGVETGREARRIDLVQIHRCMTVDDAVGERHAGAAAGGDPDRVHAAAEKQSPRLRRLAQQEGAVRREALGPVEQRPHSRGLERRQPVQGVPHHRLEVVPVFGQQLEGEVLAEPVGVDGPGVRLEAADEQPTRIVADVEMAVVIGQRRHVALDALDRLGEQIEVLARPDRHLRPGHGRDLAAPQTGAERDGFASNHPSARLDAGDSTSPGEDAGHARVLEDPRLARAGSLDQCGAEIGRTDAAIVGRPDGADDVLGVHQRPALLRLPHRNGPGAHPEQVRQRLLASDVNEPVFAGGDRERALVDPAGRLAGLLLQLRVERDGVADEIGETAGRAKRPHLGGGVPRGAGGQPVALEQDGVGDAGLGEVIEGRAAHDPAADDDDGGVGGQGGVGHGASLVQSVGGAKAPRPEWFAVCVAAGPGNIRSSMKTRSPRRGPTPTRRPPVLMLRCARSLYSGDGMLRP